MVMRHLPLSMKLVADVLPKDINGAAQGGNFLGTSLRNYFSATVLVAVGAHSGNAVAVTLQQMKNVEGNGAKALGFTDYYELKPNASPAETSDRWDAKTASSNTFNIAANTIYAIPIKQAMLDVTNNFDCIRPNLAAGSASTLVFCGILLGDGKYGISGDVDHIPSAKVNSMSATN